MKKQRLLLTVQYVGEDNYLNVSWGNKTFTFKRNAPLSGIPHEMLEMMIADSPHGTWEIVGTEKDVKKEVVIIKTTEEVPAEPIKKKGRPFKG